MDAVAVGPVGGDRHKCIAMIIGITQGHLAAQRVETAAIYAQFDARCTAAGRRYGIDRTTQRRSTQPQRIAAPIHLQMLEDLRVQFLEIAIVVGGVDGNAILQQGQAAHVIAARQA